MFLADDEIIIHAKVPEDKRSYSSVLNNEAIGTGTARSVIDSAQAWSSNTNQAGDWMQLDLGREQSVIGTVTQPRAAPFSNQYVTEYTVSTSLDGGETSWKDISGVYEGAATGIKENIFSDGSSVRARYVRLIVKSWNEWVSMRADVLILDGMDGIDD